MNAGADNAPKAVAPQKLVRLQLHALAYNLDNFLRASATPEFQRRQWRFCSRRVRHRQGLLGRRTFIWAK